MQEFIVFEALKRVLKLDDTDVERSSASAYGIYAKIERKYHDTNLKEIHIDRDRKVAYLYYKGSAGSFDIASLNKLGGAKVYPIKEIDEDIDYFRLEPDVKDGVCVEMTW